MTGHQCLLVGTYSTDALASSARHYWKLDLLAREDNIEYYYPSRPPGEFLVLFL